MLAATIALSPVVSYGVVGSPVQVEAATNYDSQIDAYVDYLDAAYDKLTDEEKAEIQYARAELNNLRSNTISWSSYADEIAKDGSASDAQKQLFEGFVDIFASSVTLDVEGLKGNLDTFRTEYSNAVDEVFNESEVVVTVPTLLGFLGEVQTNYLNSLRGKDIQEIAIFNAFVTAMESSTINKAVGEKLFTIVSPAGVFNVLEDLADKVDNPDTDLTPKEAVISALKKVQPSDYVGSPTTPTTPEQGEVTLPEGAVVDGVIPADKVQDIVNAVTAEKSIIPVKIDGTSPAEVPANLFSEVVKKNAKAVVEVKTDVASYKLPASEINVADLAKSLGVAAADVKITVSVKVVDVTPKEGKLASKVVEFKIEAVAGDKKQPVSTFSTYVERAIAGDQNFNANNSVAVVLDDNGAVLKSVPTVFDGKTATIKSLTNSKYAIVANDVTFPDVKSGWAKEYIETLASKYIIKGHDTGKFAPQGTTTRAEFAVLLVRALGLPGETYDKRFTDVKGTEWFNKDGELAAAVKHGIIQGVGNNKFDPNGKVTRAQAATMIANAIELGFLNFDKSQFDSKKQLTTFKDASKVPAWASEEMTAVLQAGIMGGHADNTIDAKGFTTREQVAKIVAEFLVKSKLMNDTTSK